MSKVDDGSVAEVYAQALFDLAEQRKQSDDIEVELAELINLLESDQDFRTFLQNPVIDSERRGPVLEKLFRGKMTDTLLDALLVINRRGRMDCLQALKLCYHKLLFNRRRRLDVHVTSAVALDEELRRQLAGAVSGRFQREAFFIEKVDPDLLGGLVVRIGDTKFDGSVSHQLKRVHQSLMARASNELHSGQAFVDTATS